MVALYFISILYSIFQWNFITVYICKFLFWDNFGFLRNWNLVIWIIEILRKIFYSIIISIISYSAIYLRFIRLNLLEIHIRRRSAWITIFYWNMRNLRFWVISICVGTMIPWVSIVKLWNLNLMVVCVGILCAVLSIISNN